MKQSGMVNFQSVHKVPRGGETSAIEGDEIISDELGIDPESTADSAKQKDLASKPLIDAETFSLALRLTCETNRRLSQGTSTSYLSKHDIAKSGSQPSSHDQHQLVSHPSVDVRMSQHSPGAVGHPLETAAKQIKVVSELERSEERLKEQLTIFHASKPRKDELDAEQRGVSRWGPDLKVYVDSLLAAIGLEDHNNKGDASASTVSTHTKRKQPTTPLEDERQLILSLTVMYLDRATTSLDSSHVDPNTGQPWYPPIPYLLPRTAHRLVLTAMIVATKSVRGHVDASTILREAANSLLQNNDDKQLQINQDDLQQMEQLMMHALGGIHNQQYPYHHYETTWHIPPDEIGKFIRKWGETFYPKRLAAQDERNRSRMERLERFWRDQTSVFGYGQHMSSGYSADHGHGNHGVGWDGHQMHADYYEPLQHHGNPHYHRVGYEFPE
jgi:hypothetical protein